ncbi:glycosyltransferase [Ponticoccus sp. (in: a-proteobacteria)]|uniref:glycosyltransferase n=1 Tax=Ponticoccus sp. (in: a-proteobacteria) TaxID=1925025 RepID=UPI003AB7187F
MTHDTAAGPVALSIILPASNEAALIGDCLSAVLASDWPGSLGAVETLVIANGCHDATAERARALQPAFAERGWPLTVLDRAEGGKLGALNAGDALASGPIRVYLDADVTVSPPLLHQLALALSPDTPLYASGSVRITAQGAASRAYARFWRHVPFMVNGVPGCGLFAVNARGRARWGAFPDIISDDTFVRLSFAPRERRKVPAPYRWPIAEGLAALIRVRRRQDAGVRQIEREHPALLANDDKPPFPTTRKLALALRDPLAFATYTAVALAVKLSPQSDQSWTRSR